MIRMTDAGHRQGNDLMVDQAMLDGATEAADFLKALGNENRLLILCHLSEGEMSVSELETALGLRQPTLSQQLARLRTDELVDTRRDGKTIYYSLASDEVRQLLDVMYNLFCSAEAKAAREKMAAARKSAAA
jgi:DNA-binding transcriptional ArsR family regulator